jgi:hypothetical protein
MTGSFLTKWERVIKDAPLDGHVMEPIHSQAHQIAAVICGHDFVYYRLNYEENAAFHTFVLEVLRTHGVG